MFGLLSKSRSFRELFQAGIVAFSGHPLISLFNADPFLGREFHA
jgi:hypothetical protein